jgi:hypothetical protein
VGLSVVAASLRVIYRTVVVAVSIVRVVEMLADAVIDVVAVRHRDMAAVHAVRVTLLVLATRVRQASGRVQHGDRNGRVVVAGVRQFESPVAFLNVLRRQKI